MYLVLVSRTKNSNATVYMISIVSCHQMFEFKCLIVNQQTENATGHDYTPLKVYIKLKKLRHKESFQWGKMEVFRDRDLLMYTRKADGFPGYLVAINFGSDNLTGSFCKSTGISKKVKVVFHTHKKDNTIFNPLEISYKLDAGHAVVLEYD